MRILWPLAMLTMFIASFRRSAPDAAAVGDAAAPCDHATPSDSADAVGRLERCLAADPADVEAMLDLGIASEAAHPDRAEMLYRRALTVEPHDARVHVRLGRLLLARGDLLSARREGEAALRWHVGNAAALRLVAETHAR